ncbi:MULTISPECIES: phosphotransferase family protein [Brochothrix]|uniref:Phosphotransferase n=2 Tax=Brochothrix thermosphacta TaxID=2756 RepID=A0A1D2KV45_BROTH|nr:MULTISPECIES: phosphotransferase family protein [Brochothrix]SLN01934.1 aminoglycoside phosphotransferase family protein [Brachybacterium faecium]ANZ95898.1 hypothetical protein BFC19_11130 [Brochothrix thermosphacta]ANZ97968.1 hypothetical protein BFC20_09795 [Brochothrix thermosphacta]ATF25188.1 phosphotransferase [Brochothrix thermosphacta]ATH84571.1 phosphotransferase [Brochothrix thermosphacta]
MTNYLGRQWDDLQPAGGESGQAYFATNHEGKFFLKRNSTPFLAVLSAEGFVPRLKWTQRLENGDVITAQKWANGHLFTHEEMTSPRVIDMMQRIHTSRALNILLKKIDAHVMYPNDWLTHVKTDMADVLSLHPQIKQALRYLESNQTLVASAMTAVVCHGDVNHNNWLLSDEDELFLVDWDGAVLSDVSVDLSMLLYRYIPKENWSNWLETYGMSMTPLLQVKLKWYMLCNVILTIKTKHNSGRLNEMNKWLIKLEKVLNDEEL